MLDQKPGTALGWLGSHRRVNLADLLAYREDMVARRRAVLDQMSRDAEELGLYD